MAEDSTPVTFENIISAMPVAPVTPRRSRSTTTPRSPVYEGMLSRNTRRMLSYILFILMVCFILSLNFLPLYTNDTSTESQVLDINDGSRKYTFSTYYRGNYTLCQQAHKVKFKSGKIEQRNEHCWTGRMDATMMFRDVAMSTYTRVYFILALEVPYRGQWWKFWRWHKSPFSTSVRNNRLFIGLSGLELDRKSDKTILNGISPSVGPVVPKATLKNYWPDTALKLSTWNEFSTKGPICSYKATVHHPVPNQNQKSFKLQDEFYLMGLRRFVLNEFERISKFDTSLYNPFNFLSNRHFGSKFATGIGEDFEVIDDFKWMDNEAGTDDDFHDMGIINPEISGEFLSGECGISVRFAGAERDMTVLDGMLNRFSILFLVKSIIECIILCTQFKKIDEEAQGQTISIISLCMISYQEILEIFLLLYHGSVFQNALMTFGSIMFLKFFMLSVVEHSFVVLIWRANHSAHIREGWLSTQKRFVLFYRYYFSFILILVVIWYFFYESNPLVILLTYLSWIPQIMLDIWRGHSSALNFIFILLLSACRLVLPCYIFLGGENIFNMDMFSLDAAMPSPSIGFSIILVKLVQIMLICLQRLYGPRCFASLSILPQIYNYVRPWSKMMEDDPQECVICMYDILQSNRDWCLTPCDHLFHANCLREWTSIKLECPNCRRPLPPVS
ncbi:hypothetical protein BEWA_003190 [Theileria equi strain WA]|uniref:RING-type E3 ubiquitin transferase n=1 Tax=Theileria equi strain WA TaxID=1537102 RepID=L0B111_THEEQ|nr:hypothetical protein BEWA_003190 [Theileria equi strain WA]AFZ80911.1 hypothetical protein BEWA_003190 [Theileria equi strain WA]|eukprot:XP_004830577.1 hypothetical protein BEWA_003190 [Theileria equi strain WA]